MKRYPRFWNESRETLSRDERLDYKFNLFKQMLNYLNSNSPFYQRKFQKAGLLPSDIRSPDDIQKVPFTTKEEIRKNQEEVPPFGDILCVDLEKCIKLHATSGSTGMPIKNLITRYDRDMWAEYLAETFWTVGVRPDDIFQNSVGVTLFMGQANQYGIEKLGALYISMGTGRSEFQIQFLKEIGTTIMNTTPSYAVYLTKVAKTIGINPERDTPNLRIWTVGGEPGGSIPSTKNLIESFWRVRLKELYGMSELLTPTSFSCFDSTEGMHVVSGYQLVELIDANTGEDVSGVGDGEIVISNLEREGMPLLRFKTGDIATINKKPCVCGRTSERIDSIIGRSDDMLIVKGTNVFPSAIENIIRSMPELTGEYQIVIKRDQMDELFIKAEFEKDIPLSQMSSITEKLRNHIRNRLSINTNVELVHSGTLPVTELKAKRVIDVRNKQSS